MPDLFKQNVDQLSPEQRLSTTVYTVRKGDTVSAIARKYNTKPEVIREINDLPSGTLTVGTDLRVPSAAAALPPKVMLAAARVDGRRGAGAGGRPHVHVVRRGDTLWAVARRTGMDVNTLATMNGMQPGDTLRAGQKLKLTASRTERRSRQAGVFHFVVRQRPAGDVHGAQGRHAVGHRPPVSGHRQPDSRAGTT